MNRVIKHLFVASALLLGLACDREEVGPSSIIPDGVEITITAVRENFVPDTKTVMESDGSVVWSPMDEISVFYNDADNGGSRFTAQNTTENTAIAEFKGKVDGIMAGGEYFTNGKYLYGIYPYSANTIFKDGIATITLPSDQAAVAGTFANGVFPTMARSQNMNLAFYNICGGVKFTVSRDDITSVSFKGNSGEKLAGSANVTFDENEKPALLDDENSNGCEITVYAPVGGTFEIGKEYYIVAYPAELGSGFTITFRTTEKKEGSYVSNTAVEIQRSLFGVLNNIDKNVTEWRDITTEGGGYNSGMYVGIIGFNADLFRYPVCELTGASKDGLYSFINSLSMSDGTLLYRSVEQSINTLQSVPLPVDLSKVAIVTFTDGLDKGSIAGTAYVSESEYLNTLHARITEEYVSGQPITAYSVGIRGKDIQENNVTSFRNNLKKLASSDANATEVTNMNDVNIKFKEIAEQLSNSTYLQTINLKIPITETGKRIRFTFDNVKSAELSNLYIEGTFNRETSSLENVKYRGLKSTSGTEINGTVDRIFANFIFNGVKTDENVLIEHKFTDEWTYENNVWQINSEFQKQQESEIVNTRSSAAVILVLDCSSSLDKGFSRVQASAKDFINTLNTVIEGSAGEIPVNNASIYSTKPVDLSLAISKGGTRYYLTKEEYAKANLNDVVIEGLCVVSGTDTPFIIALRNASSNTIKWSSANDLYDLITYEQGSTITERWNSINNALTSFGGTAITAAWTNEQRTGSYYYISGGTISYTTNSKDLKYVRPAVSIDSLEIPWMVYPEEDLTLVVTNGEDRQFMDKDEYEKLGIESGYQIEGLAVCSRYGNFILALQDVSNTKMQYLTALEMYGENALPDFRQGKVISSRWTDINNALKAFGGKEMISVWVRSKDNTFYYADNRGGNAGGEVLIGSDFTDQYVRCVVGTF